MVKTQTLWNTISSKTSIWVDWRIWSFLVCKNALIQRISNLMHINSIHFMNQHIMNTILATNKGLDSINIHWWLSYIQHNAFWDFLKPASCSLQTYSSDCGWWVSIMGLKCVAGDVNASGSLTLVEDSG